MTKKSIPWQRVHGTNDGRKLMCDSQLEESRPIYHMLEWHHALSIFENRRLRLSPVRSWKRADPYEKWWCDLLFNTDSKLANAHAYGICWTTGWRDEPRWRMVGFNRCKPIVRIKSTAGAILKAGIAALSSSPTSLYFGEVRYRRTHELQSLAQSFVDGDEKDVSRIAAERLLHKRLAFEFEQEVRLLWVDNQPVQSEVYVEIDPTAVILDVLISPYANSDECREIRSQIGKYMKPRRSLLLAEPEAVIPRGR